MGFCATGIFGSATKFKKIFEWNELDFDYPSPAQRQHDIDTGVFIPGIPAPIDMDVHYGGKNKEVFIYTNYQYTRSFQLPYV